MDTIGSSNSTKGHGFEDVPFEPGAVRRHKSKNFVFGRYFGKLAAHKKFFRPGESPLTVVAMLYFDDAPSETEFIELIRERILIIPRFRSVLRSDNKNFYSYPYWEEMDISSIDMAYHFETLEGTYDNTALENYLAKLTAEYLDLEKPLWKFKMAKTDKGETILITYVYHCIADGTALVQTLTQNLMDSVNTTEGGDPTLTGKAPVKRKKSSVNPLTFTTNAIKTSSKIALKPVLPGDSKNMLKLKNHRKPSGMHKFAFTEKIDLDRAKFIKNAYKGSSLNDVILAVMTITLRRCLKEEKDDVMNMKKFRISGSFPYDMRSKNVPVMDEKGYGNIISIMDFVFPLKTDTEALVPEIKKQVDKLKISPAPYVQLKLLDIITKFLPPKIQHNILLDIGGKNSAMLSNVRGPSKLVSIGGKQVKDINFVGSVPIGLYFGCLTYNNELSASIALDNEVPCSADALTKQWLPAFEELYEVAKARDTSS